MSVLFDEEKITYDFKPWHSQATREGLVAWEDIDDLREEIFPAPVPLSTTQTGGFGTALPGKAWLRADSMRIVPLGEKIVGPTLSNGSVDTTQELATLAEWEKARVVITYVTPLYGNGLDLSHQPINGDPVAGLDHKWSTAAEFLTIPPVGATWHFNVTQPVPDNIHQTVRVPITEHQLTWPYVVYPPFIAIRAAVGKVNAGIRVYRTGAASEQSLLFTGAELSGQVMSDGTLGYQITYRFSERHVYRASGVDLGWNGVWNPIAGEWDKIVFASGQNMYQESSDSFASLFKSSPTG